MRKMILKELRIVIFIFAGLICFMNSGCVTLSEQRSDQSGDFVLCKEPRPEICTHEYAPVTGYFADGSHKVYSNACSACSDKQVVKYKVESQP